MQKLFRLPLLLLLLIAGVARANEGMWLPQLLNQLNEKEMKAMGMKISAADIYSVNKGSLKDAIVSFGGFCTAEVISTQGLILTNHHCGYGQIQNHSTVDRNYLKDGFWARSKGEELPNAGLTATFIVRIDDVTKQVLAGVTDAMTEKERQSAVDKNIDAVSKAARKETWQDVSVRPFYNGNQYYLFVVETYKDVRLVGAPPSSIGKFGADTDNWMWPRHTGDFALFRIYADKNNRPAAFAADNVPYIPKKALSISLDGVAEGDFTMVFGFPGRTQQYLPAVAVQQVAQVSNPIKIDIRDQTLKIWDSYMRSDAHTNLQYASKYASLSNAWKKWIGESKGLNSTGAVANKLKYEAEFQKRVDANPAFKAKYGDLLPQLNAKYAQMEPYAVVRDYFSETANAVELFKINTALASLANAYHKNGVTGYEERKKQVMTQLENLYKNYNAEIDQKVFVTLMNNYFKNVDRKYIGEATFSSFEQQRNAEQLAQHLYRNTSLSNFESLKKTLEKSPEAAIEALQDDAAVVFMGNMIESYNSSTTPLNTLQNEINQLQRTYMHAQMDVFPEKRFYPDANSTLRVTYGKAQGYAPRDAVVFDRITYLEGVMEKYKPGDYEFDVPQKLIELYKKKDYGRYGVNGKMPVNFIASNHTTGGNSGSPALDAHGNLVGLNFDRVWEGTMSDISYDPDICRNIMVDARYILFIIDKYAGATNLIAEMKLVNPKKQATAKKKK